MTAEAEERLPDKIGVAGGPDPGIQTEEAETERVQAAPQWIQTTFLCGSPAAYGLLTDAVPAASRYLLTAAGGYSAGGGVSIPLYTACGGGVKNLIRETFPMLSADGVSEDILGMTFGDCTSQREHPLARFCAALAEAVGTEYLSDTGGGRGDISADDACAELGLRISGALESFHKYVIESDDAGSVRRRRGLRAVSPEFFDVSFGACRLTPDEGDGNYSLEIFAAGDFRVFLLDGEGLFPLWIQSTGRISPGVSDTVRGSRQTLCHREPFALFLLSDSVCAPFRIGIAEKGTAPVRERMRLEERLLRIVSASAVEQEIGVRAAQELADLAAGEAGVSGAATVLTGVRSGYEEFRDACDDRLHVLEQDAALLPEGYDPDLRTDGLSRAEAERKFVRDLFETRSDIREKTAAALERLAREYLNGMDTGRDGELHLQGETRTVTRTEGSGTLFRSLTAEDVYREFRRFDAANDEPRGRIEQRRLLIREFLSEHWITLRPLLCAPGAPGRTDIPAEEAARAEEQYRCCLNLNRRLEQVLRTRRAALTDLKSLLSDCLARAEREGENWILGRCNAESCPNFLNEVGGKLPGRLSAVGAAWGTGAPSDAGNFVSLQTAYTAEREKLFGMDAAPGGLFSGMWLMLQDGTVPSETFSACREAVAAGAGEKFAAALDMLAVLSEEIKRLKDRIASYDAARRCIRSVADNFEWQFVCLRNAVYKEGGEDGQEVTDGPADNATAIMYRRAVQEWQEERTLDERRRATYTAYRDAWSRYLRDE